MGSMRLWKAPVNRSGRRLDLCCLASALVATLLLLPPPVTAQEVLSPQPWTVESYGRVLAMSRVADTLYIGGNFGLVGPATGQGAPVSLDEGKPLEVYPKV